MKIKHVILLFFYLGLHLINHAQEVHSKYPCDSAVIYDVLVSGAAYSGTSMDRQYELQSMIKAKPNSKKITGRYAISFVVHCDGTTSNFNDAFKGNTLIDEEVVAYVQGMAESANWNPAIHRNARVPHRVSISVEIRKGHVKAFNLP